MIAAYGLLEGQVSFPPYCFPSQTIPKERDFWNQLCVDLVSIENSLGPAGPKSAEKDVFITTAIKPRNNSIEKCHSTDCASAPVEQLQRRRETSAWFVVFLLHTQNGEAGLKGKGKVKTK